MAAKTAPSALVVATRAADGGCGAGYNDPPFALQGGYCARLPKGPEESHQHQGGTCRVLRTLLGRWEAHWEGAASGTVGALAAGEVGAAQWHCIRVGPPQMGEQLPNIVPPVPGGDGGVGFGSLQGTLPRQNSAALHIEQTVDIPVPGRAGGGERGGLQGFAGQGSTASSSHVGAANGAGKGFFSHFSPKEKKCEARSALLVGTECGL